MTVIDGFMIAPHARANHQGERITGTNCTEIVQTALTAITKSPSQVGIVLLPRLDSNQ